MGTEERARYAYEVSLSHRLQRNRDTLQFASSIKPKYVSHLRILLVYQPGMVIYGVCGILLFLQCVVCVCVFGAYGMYALRTCDGIYFEVEYEYCTAVFTGATTRYEYQL